MKSSERCKETFQGDRCKRERGHETVATDNPNVHVGLFTMWNEHGPLLKAQGSQPRKRNRLANRAIRDLKNIPIHPNNPEPMKKAIGAHLDRLIAHFGGAPQLTENK